MHPSLVAGRSAPVKERRLPAPVRPVDINRADAALAPSAPTAVVTAAGATSFSAVAGAIAPVVVAHNASSRTDAKSIAGPSGCDNTTNSNIPTDAARNK